MRPSPSLTTDLERFEALLGRFAKAHCPHVDFQAWIAAEKETTPALQDDAEPVGTKSALDKAISDGKKAADKAAALQRRAAASAEKEKG